MKIIGQSSLAKQPLSLTKKYIFFFDLDETLYDHNDHSHYWFHELDAYLKRLREKRNILFGILTGCNMAEAIKKIRNLQMKQFPDFLSFGFGSELYYADQNNELVEDLKWADSLKKNYQKSIITKITTELEKYNIHLILEERSTNDLKDSYYYYENKLQKFHLRIIQLIAEKFNIKTIISKCNHNIGDPKDAYDIDFVPLNAGKEKVAQYIMKKNTVGKNNAFAFGDSENDLRLLKSVANGYAVLNATDELKNYGLNICSYNHAHGILHTLQQHFEGK